MKPGGGRTSLYFDLLDGFQQPGCSICRYTLRAVERFFASLTYENTNDYDIRSDVRAARGFCNRHTMQYVGLADELGTAIICRDLLHTVLPALAEATPSGLTAMAAALTDLEGRRAAERALKALAPTQTCLACRRLLAAEDDYRSTLLRHLESAEFAAAFAASSGLCTVHGSQALQQSRGIRRDVLRRVQRQSYSALLQHLATAGPDEPVSPPTLTASVGGQDIRP
ncbi:MAG TPA: DUF6062 family protein [Chloroflexota bacterium]|jgi:hypothetical protein